MGVIEPEQDNRPCQNSPQRRRRRHRVAAAPSLPQCLIFQ
jgi:hypothetical protein